MVNGAVAVVVDDRLAGEVIDGTVPRPLARLFDAGIIDEALAVWVYENAGDLGAFALVRPEGIVRRWHSHDEAVLIDDGAPLVAEIMVRDADPELDDQAALFAMAVASYILGETLDQWDGLESDALVFDSSLAPRVSAANAVPHSPSPHRHAVRRPLFIVYRTAHERAHAAR